MKIQYYLRGLGIGIIVTALVMGITKDRKEPLTEAEIRAMALEIGMVDSNSLKLTDTQASGEPDSFSGTPEPGEPSGDEGPGEGEDGEEPEEPEEPSGDERPGEGEDGEEPGEPSGDERQEEGEDGEEPEEPEEPSGDERPGEGEDGEEPGEPSGDERQEEGEDGEEPEEPEEPSGDEGQPDEGITVEIEPGAGSRAICRMLEEAGLIEDADSFDRYLIDNGYSKRIRMGTYVIIPGTDPEEIARIITRDR